MFFRINNAILKKLMNLSQLPDDVIQEIAKIGIPLTSRRATQESLSSIQNVSA